MENLHQEIIGASGTGKSTLLKSLILSRLDFPILFIDPLGHNALDLLDHLPSSVKNCVCYIDLGSTTHAVGFNPIDAPHHLTPAFKGIWASSWGQRMDWRIFNAIGAVHETGRSLHDAYRMFFNEEHREQIVGKLPPRSPYREFWTEQYARQTDRYNQEANEAVINKLGQFLASPPIRAAYSILKPPLTLQKALQHRYIVIVNLNAPVVGDEHAHLYASLLLSRFKTALMQNPTQAFVFLDEFQTYAAHHVPYFSSVLRNFGLSLTLSHQLFAQVDHLTQDAIMTNMAIKTVFRTSPSDADIIAPYFNQDPQQDFSPIFSSLPNFAAWQNDRGMIAPITTTPPASQRSHRDDIIRKSNERFAAKL